MKRVAAVAAALIAALVLLTVSVGWLRPSVDRSSLRTARVTRGPIESVIEASGVVIPASETVISSPVDARILRITRRAGSAVQAGDEIVQLDTSSASLDLVRLQERLAQKINERTSAAVRLEETLTELASRREQTQLDLEILRYRQKQNQTLRSEGLIAEETLRESVVAASKADVALRQMDASAATTRRTSAASMATIDNEIRTIQKEIRESQATLERASARADRGGVITWVPAEEGATVRRGDVIARLSDLSSFRVKATVTDLHAGRIIAGAPVRLRINGQAADGVVAGIDPTVRNGAVEFSVALTDPRAPQLRSNLRVDVHVVTSRKPDALKVRTGSFYRGAAHGTLFIIRGATAVQKSVRFGAVAADEVEITSGAAEGDEVITSDMTDWGNARQIRVKR